MPTSCNLLFDVVRTMAAGEAIELSLRELAEMCRLSYEQTRRALRRLQGANLLRWENPGPARGHRSVFEIRWSPPSFPQEKDSSFFRDSSSGGKENFSFAKAKTAKPSSAPPTSQLRGQAWVPSEKAVRWGLARARERLWGLPRHRRERAMDALAVAFRWAARQPGPWDRDRWRRFVMATVARFDEPDGDVFVAEDEDGNFVPDRRRPFSWAMRCAQEALQELRQGDRELAATETTLARIQAERQAAREAWAEAVTNVPILHGIPILCGESGGKGRNSYVLKDA